MIRNILAILLVFFGSANAKPYGEYYVECIVSKPANQRDSESVKSNCEKEAEKAKEAELVGRLDQSMGQASSQDPRASDNLDALMDAPVDHQRARLDALDYDTLAKQYVTHEYSERQQWGKMAISATLIAFFSVAVIACVRSRKTIITSISKTLSRANTKLKRISLIASPFPAVAAIYRLNQDLDHYSWEPSLGFFVFAMALILCLAIALTSLGDWVAGK